MNMKFSCEICKYSTERKADYEKHIISGKHKKASIELGKVNTGTKKIMNVYIAIMCQIHKII